jgi:hypothetical protein
MNGLQQSCAKNRAFTGCYMATVENKSVKLDSADSGSCGSNRGLPLGEPVESKGPGLERASPARLRAYPPLRHP